MEVFATSTNANFAVRDQIVDALNANIELQSMGITAALVDVHTQIRLHPRNASLGWGEVEVVSSEPVLLSASWSTQLNGMIQEGKWQLSICHYSLRLRWKRF